MKSKLYVFHLDFKLLFSLEKRKGGEERESRGRGDREERERRVHDPGYPGSVSY